MTAGSKTPEKGDRSLKGTQGTRIIEADGGERNAMEGRSIRERWAAGHRALDVNGRRQRPCEG